METGSILIKEKRKHFPKHQTGCLKWFGAQALEVLKGRKNSWKYILIIEAYSLSYKELEGAN
jgi:hypothetical protein